MKEASFYTLVNPLSDCENFKDYLKKVVPIAEELFGAGDYGVITCHLREHEPILEGHAREYDSFRQIAKALQYDLGCAGPGSGGPSQNAVQNFLNDWIAENNDFAHKSIRVARLSRGEFFGCFLLGVKKETGFTSEEADLFASLGLFSEQLIGRLNMIRNDEQIRKQLFAFRDECPAAFFHFEPGKGLMPMNHQAVIYSEKNWHEDEPVYMPRHDMLQRMDDVMGTSWKNPIEACWSSMQLDLGGGEVEVYVIPRTKGDGILMLQNRPKTEALAKASDYLTKRQEEIMDWIAEGKTSSEVAVILDISPRTVEKHLEAIFQRLGVENRITAVRRYLELKGLIET